MSDSKEPRVQPLGLLEEDPTTSGIRLFPRDFQFQQTHGHKSSTVPFLRGPVYKVPSSLSQEQSEQDVIYQNLTQLKAAVGELSEKSKLQEIYQELTQLKAAVGELPEKSKLQEIYQELTRLKAAVERLCCRCPKDWTFFQGNCYFMSNSQRNWHDSVTACQEVGAQLVVIKSAEEQNFLQLQTYRSNRFSWMGLSDLNQEGTWQWVDGSPLSSSFQRYWNSGEPNNSGDEDCAEFSGSGWNDNRCNIDNYWICKKPTACFRDE
ncbi:C-type lectin domain family 4 member M isoform X8 [Nomascus leucogenys]|uniref:C-type lectin domain family 4 member M isoform X8 n=1 Tax=Nomascus leucogenys TaxID=61853 RepID=UPI00122D81E8|nr:C-type lectin domain family 4 member M isoform X8 [Nomascus leucogenys]